MLTDTTMATSTSKPWLFKVMHQAVERKKTMNANMPPFRMSRTPVTNAIYKMFIDAAEYKSPHHWEGNRIPEGREQHPVVYISLIDAQHFCQWAGVRLPTHQEWSLAASGPYRAKYPWGAQSPNEKYANFNYHVGDTTPVGSYPYGCSHYGLWDMAGNVWEWTSTPYIAPNHGSASPDSSNSRSRYVVCGGSFYDSFHHLECQKINWANCDAAEDMIGFRVVLESTYVEPTRSVDQFQVVKDAFNA